MKKILLWDPRFPDRRPALLTVDDALASAAVRAGVAAAADPAEQGALANGSPLDPGLLTEVVLEHGYQKQLARVMLPYSVILVGALAGVLAAIEYPVVLSGATVAATAPAAPTPTLPSTVQLTAEGDSITYGQGATDGLGGYPARARALFTAGPAYSISNVGNPGDTAASMASNYANQGLPASFNPAAALNIATLLAGVNDGPVTNRIAAYRSLRSVITSARKTGYQRVGVGTITSRATDTAQTPGDYYFDAATLPLNQDILLLWNSDMDADAMFDLGNTTHLSLATDALDPTYFYDKLHPANGGYEVAKTVYAAAINSMVAGPGVRVKPPGTFSYIDKFDSIALSNGNRTATATHSNALNAAIAVFGAVRTGKVGWEVFIDNSGFDASGSDYVMLALICRGSRYYQMGNNFYSGNDAHYDVLESGDISYNGGAVQGNIGALRTGSTVTFCVDITGATKLFWVRRNSGPWNGNASADPATGVGGLDVTPLYNVDIGLVGQQAELSMAARLYGAPAVVTSRLKASEITVPLPSGFSALAG